MRRSIEMAERASSKLKAHFHAAGNGRLLLIKRSRAAALIKRAEIGDGVIKIEVTHFTSFDETHRHK